MAEIVGSVVAHEVVNQALSSIKERYNEKSDAKVKEHMERMEMAHIKLEAALEKSHKWNTTSVPLLRWRSKLKRATQECNDMLRSCKQRLQEMEAVEDEVRSSSLPKRILHSVRSLVLSMFDCSNEEPNESTVRRFEWFAEGASEFLRYMELGGTPRLYMFFDPLVRHLLEGKGTTYGIIRGSQQLTFLLTPFYLPEHGVEVRMKLLLEDGLAPQNNFIFALYIRLSESTDIVGVTLRCIQLFAPYLRSTAETIKIKLTQLPTQDFYWVHPYLMSSHRKILDHWNNLHTIFSQWTRPNPLCCPQHSHHYAQSYVGSSTRSSSESLTCDTYLEPVSQLFLQGHVALTAGHKRRRDVLDDESYPNPMRDFPHVKVAGLFSPHASYEDLSPAVGGSATEMINGEVGHRGRYSNISFEQLLGEIMIPKAVECFRRNAAATSYQMLWKTKHGGAYLRVEETSCRATKRKGRGGKRQQWCHKKVKGWSNRWLVEFLGSWVPHAPAQLQSPITDWIQNGKHIRPLGDKVAPLRLD